MTSDDLASDLARIATIAIGLIPGAGVAGPLVGAAASVMAPMIVRLVNGESLLSIENTPILESDGIDIEALKKQLAAGV